MLASLLHEGRVVFLQLHPVVMNAASARHFVHPNPELYPVFIKALQDTTHKDGSIL
jgi:hypothetical protein